MRLEVLHGAHVVHAQAVGTAGLTLGRSSANDVVLRDPGVSGHHAVIYWDAGDLWVRDLGSTNGTFVGELRVEAPVVLRVGDVVRLGPEACLRLAGAEVTLPAALRLEQVDGPLVVVVREARIALEGGELLVREDGLWLAVGGVEAAQLEVGVPFECGGRWWVPREEHHTATARPVAGPLPYRLRVDLSREEAVLSSEDHSCHFRADHRVSLLAALAMRRRDDPPGVSRGWMDDDDLRGAVWGRDRWNKLPNNLNVLVHRVREQAERAGFERWFVERRPGRTRLQVEHVTLGS